MSFRRKGAALVVLGALVVAAVGAGHASAGASDRPTARFRRTNVGPVPPLGDHGRWLTDATGRTVTLHGVNEVYKSAPYYPAAAGFGEDDARFIASQGFNAVRLGVEFRGLMPERGQVSSEYIEHIATSVEQLAKRRIFVLLDFHQDGFSPKYNGNGMPDWMAIDDGLPNPPDAVFPLYYIQNPAMQRAFQSFWQNRAGPDGIGLQDHYVRGVTAIAERFKDQPYVMGYELMNEPWPGHAWEPCVDPARTAECQALEQQLLAPFHQRATNAIRQITTTQDVWVEPFVLFNFGQVQTTLPGKDTNNALSYHSYALDVAGEEQVVANAVAAAERDQQPLIATEFGATLDVATLDRLTTQLDEAHSSWMFWAYNEEIITDRSGPASLQRVRSRDTLRALTRPYPAAVTGTPTATSFDPGTQVYELTYSTTGPGATAYPARLDTVISVPRLRYPQGYKVEVTGAKITSRPCAPQLNLRTNPGAGEVTVRLTSGGSC